MATTLEHAPNSSREAQRTAAFENALRGIRALILLFPTACPERMNAMAQLVVKMDEMNKELRHCPPLR
jgi:hypothetical protein